MTSELGSAHRGRLIWSLRDTTTLVPPAVRTVGIGCRPVSLHDRTRCVAAVFYSGAHLCLGDGRGGNVTFEEGQKVLLPGESQYVTIDSVVPEGDGVRLFVVDRTGSLRKVTLTGAQVAMLAPLTEDGGADSRDLLAAMWAEWMASATTSAKAAALASSPLKPYPHQHQAVYDKMLPQPMLRFLLGDEPGTGKTIMGGLYAREAQRLGMVNRALVVCPAHLVTKWQADFDRFLGGGLKRITADTVREGALQLQHDFWVVSLELASMNRAVLDAVHPDQAGWDLVIFDEAHRLTPTAESFHRVGRVLALNSPRVLMMTATPHRGNEWLFRALMHLVDPDVFPPVDRTDAEQPDKRLRPGAMHFLRRMKEELYDFDGKTRLFNERHATNVKVHLSSVEGPFYRQALDLVDTYFPAEAKTLGRMVYGKRAASCLYSLAETLRRRRDGMGAMSSVEARRLHGEPDDDPAEADHDEVIHAASASSREEKRAIGELLTALDQHLNDPTHTSPADVSSKWSRMVDECLTPNGVAPGNGEQLVVFTEYADTADWLVRQFLSVGYTAERYSGRDDHATRDEVRDRFMAGEFQVIVSTDAGNEGIDLQSAHVLVNWDIPWSLVTLEQRMGRIHRVGQKRDVKLYSIIATGTLEGDTHARLLDRLVTAANELGGKMFDCLSLVGENVMGDTDRLLTQMFDDKTDPEAVRRAVDAISDDQLRIERDRILDQQDDLSSPVDLDRAVEALQNEQLERINPHIVERFLTRLADANLVTLQQSTIADDGLWLLHANDRLTLPTSLTGAEHDRNLVATYGAAKTGAVAAGNLAASAAVPLGPAEEPFRDLVNNTLDVLRPQLYRGGRLVDPTTATDYWLFLYETGTTEGGARHGSWRHLIRVDEAGARTVPFELLANLQPASGASKLPHPANRTHANACVTDAIERQKSERDETLREWTGHARRQLNRLPHDLVRGIDSPDARNAIRRQVQQAIKDRQARLETATELTLGDTKLLGWAHVHGADAPTDPTEDDSEAIAVKHVTRILGEQGWGVSDVSQEKIGYDVKARKGHLQRAIEVKGIWTSAASTGIRLTGNEIAKAGLIGDDYWLYVVDQCHDGQGTLFARYRNPADVFADLTKDVAVLRINGSDLAVARTHPNAA